MDYLIGYCLTVALVALAFRRSPVGGDPRTVFICACIVGGLLAGQLAGSTQWSYPFVKWGMYDSPRPRVIYSKHTVTTTDGSTTDYPYAIVVFSSPRALQAKLDQLVSLCRCTSRDGAVDDFIAALVSLYSQRNAVRLVSFEVSEASLRADGTEEQRVRYRWHSSQASR